jgi:hypothetical protein
MASSFAGSDEGAENWACLASLIKTCKLNNVNPQIYCTDLLTRLVNGCRPRAWDFLRDLRDESMMVIASR